LKGEKPRISEGTRDDSGSVGEVEGLIDLSMEEDYGRLRGKLESR
jgi:hypothetical protein